MLNNYLKILVVEDEEIERKALVMMLKYSDRQISEIRSAENGMIALDIYREFRPNAVLMDINLPGISGIDTIRQMKLLDPSAEFIIISAYEMFDYVQAALRLDVLDYLLKPVQAVDINRVLDEVVTVLKTSEKAQRANHLLEARNDAVLPIIETDCIFAVASMRPNLSITELLTFMGKTSDYGYCFIVKSSEKGAVIVERFKKTFRDMGITCIGDTINELCVFVVLDAKRIFIEEMREIFEYIAKCYTEALEWHAGVGNICRADDKLRLSYNQALVSLRTGVAEKRKVMFYKDVEAKKNEEKVNVKDLALRICQSINLGNYEKISEDVNELFAVLQFSMDQKEMLSHICWFFALVCNKLPDVNAEIMQNAAGRIMAYSDMEALKSFLVTVLINIADEKKNQNLPRSSQIKEAVINIISEHFTEELNLSDIAASLNFSPHYVSRVFKNATGMTFPEYLTNYRLEIAKEMLLHTDKSIKEVAYASGFNSQGYFSKIFKKYTGILPSDYHSSLQPPDSHAKMTDCNDEKTGEKR